LMKIALIQTEELLLSGISLASITEPAKQEYLSIYIQFVCSDKHM